MINLEKHRTDFIYGLVEQGWKRKKAEKFFSNMHLTFGIKDVIESIIAETKKCVLNIRWL